MKSRTSCNQRPSPLVKWSKFFINSIAKPLFMIFNKSFLSRVFLEQFKAAMVIYIFKSADKHDIKNEKATSLLPVFSKILKKKCVFAYLVFLMNSAYLIYINMDLNIIISLKSTYRCSRFCYRCFRCTFLTF